MLTDAVTQIWTSSDAGINDIKVEETYDTPSKILEHYLTKELKKFNTDVIDANNLQIPLHLLN